MSFTGVDWHTLDKSYRRNKWKAMRTPRGRYWIAIHYAAKRLHCSEHELYMVAKGHDALLERFGKVTGRPTAAIDGAFFRALKDVLSDRTEPQNSTPRKVPLRMRYIVLERAGGRCCLCGARDNLHVDHIVPYSKGGETVLENLRALCADCNIGKGALMPNEVDA